jgi:hypothetical protein
MSGTYGPDAAWDPKQHNFAVTRRDALVKLIKNNVSYFKDVLAEINPVTRQGAAKQAFPCVMVSIAGAELLLETNAKYTFRARYAVRVYSAGNNPAAAKDDVVMGFECIQKLLSNNAYGDLLAANPTYRYMTYPTFWNQSSFEKVEYFPPVPFQSDNTSEFWLLWGRGFFEIEWVAID